MPPFDFGDLRRREFARLDRLGEVYLDYTGSALYPACLVSAHARQLEHTILGNPHSENGPSARATVASTDARRRVLEFFDADPAGYDVVFTANASAAFRLVGEAFPFGPGSRLRLIADNHNSVNGVRERARARRASIEIVPIDDELRPRIAPLPWTEGPSLLAFPAQSNFSGARHPLDGIGDARARGWRVLLDAAAFVPTVPLSLRATRPDFVGISFYKMFGYPTGIGALIARHDALAELERPWFAGGTVDYVSIAHDRHQRARGHAGFEDGTPDFLAYEAVTAGLDFLAAIGMDAVSAHAATMTAGLLDRLSALGHGNGRPMVRLHGPRGLEARGGTVAFTVLDREGRPLPYEAVERDAAANRIALRGGCFCNPGCAEASFGLDDDATVACLDALGPGDFTPQLLRACLQGRAVGGLRASVGLPTTVADLDALHAFLHTSYRNRSLAA